MNLFPVFMLTAFLWAASTASSHAQSSPLNIVVDIPFVASLAAELVDEDDSVTTLIGPNDSPHTYSLRPRAVRALQKADLVITVADELSPNITRALANVAEGRTVNLADANGIFKLPSRGLHDHNPHRDISRHNEHKDSHDGDHDEPLSDYVSTDPHLWLSPENVQVFVNSLRDELISLDPARASSFKNKAALMIQNIQAFDAEQTQRWSQAAERTFISLHDATYYFEHHFNLASRGSLFADSHATPGVQQLKALQTLIKSDNITCIVADANTPQSWVNTLTEGLKVNAVSVDVLGYDPKPVSYLTTLIRLSESFAQCLDIN